MPLKLQFFYTCPGTPGHVSKNNLYGICRVHGGVTILMVALHCATFNGFSSYTGQLFFVWSPNS